MRDSWALPEQMLPLSEWAPVEVLVEFNGPQLVLNCFNERLYLASASDDESGIVRWVSAPISEIELVAIRERATTIREVLLKDRVSVLDVEHDTSIIAEYEVSGSAIAEELPDFGSLLPADHPDEYVPAMAGPPALILDGRVLKENKKPSFSLLGEVVAPFQRLWTGIGRTLSGGASEGITELSELRLSGVSTGSAVLEIETTHVTFFNKVSSRYRELVLSSGDANALTESIKTLDQKTRGALEEFTRALSKHRLESFARSAVCSAYLGPFTATRARMTLLAKATQTAEKTVSVVGYFVKIGTKDGKFNFVSAEDGAPFTGTVAPALMKSQLPITLVLGAGGQPVLYKCDFVIVTKTSPGGTPKDSVSLVGATPA